MVGDADRSRVRRQGEALTCGGLKTGLLRQVASSK